MRSIFILTVVCIHLSASWALLYAPPPGDLSPNASSDAGAAGHPDNMCIGGKLVSETYVLGAKNSGTSSLYIDLKTKYGIWQAPDNGPAKEWFFFAKGEKARRADWLREHLPCPAGRSHMVDFCVMNLFLVPLPDDLTHSLKFGFPSKPDLASYTWNTPALVKKWYGERAGALKFEVVLREPLSRSQSEYYHTLPIGNCMGCNSRSSFAAALGFNANLSLMSPPKITDWLWKSMYARHFEAWLRYFPADQFTVIPFRLYVQFDTRAVATHFIDEFGQTWATPFVTPSRSNAHPHPPLVDELPLGHRARVAFNQFFRPENARLVRVLQQLGQGGGKLLGFSADLQELGEVKKWLESAW
mmetsp:Transcript_110473/g.312476  ORF Transcript_110473/g.312476 Transcript_110473/m.312476 type:complete len:357 (-) Transcript_110473:131-1201(-)